MKDKGDIGIVALGCSLVPIDGGGVEGDIVEDHVLVPSFGVNTDA